MPGVKLETYLLTGQIQVEPLQIFKLFIKAIQHFVQILETGLQHLLS